MYFHFKKLKSFTSVEMVIVIVMIIGLSILAISTFQKNSFVPKDDLRRADIEEITRSVEEYKKSNGNYYNPYPSDSCLGDNSYKSMSTRNTTFREDFKNVLNWDDIRLPRENYIYVVSCSLDEFSIVGSMDKESNIDSAKSFLSDFLSTIPGRQRSKYYFPTK